MVPLAEVGVDSVHAISLVGDVELHFDIDVDPYPIFRRLREEAPLYYNEKYDFYALSRFADVEAASGDAAEDDLVVDGEDAEWHWEEVASL